MGKVRQLALLVVIAHWITAVSHLFIAAKVVPHPSTQVNALGITLMTFGHLIIFVVVWKLSNKLAGWVSLIFFLLAMSADLYEHFVNRAPNNVLMVRGPWTAGFDFSVFLLLALELLACVLGILLLVRRPAAA